MLEKYLTSVWNNDRKMVDYCMKSHKYLQIGEWFVSIGDKKPSIKSTMYYSDVTDGPDLNRQNFIDYNSKFSMPNLLDAKNFAYYLGIQYSNQTTEKLASIWTMTIYTVRYWEEKPEATIREFTPEEIEIINDGIQELRDDYLNRLNKYFDRYGNKISRCGYWADR